MSQHFGNENIFDRFTCMDGPFEGQVFGTAKNGNIGDMFWGMQDSSCQRAKYQVMEVTENGLGKAVYCGSW